VWIRGYKKENQMTSALQTLSDATAAIVESAGRGIVRVEARRRLPASGIAWSADGVIVTAHHVVEQDDNIEIGLADGKTVTAKLIGRDPTTDIAVLRATGATLAPLALAEVVNLRVGHIVLALARPGNDVMATMGIVSALSDKWRTPMGGVYDRYVQTDVAMYPGFSGGALVDASGQILGLNTSAVLRDTTISIPVPTLRRVVDALLKNGKVRRGYIGVRSQPVKLPEKIQAQLKQESGLLLLSVEADSPAERGGLAMGDTIVAMGGDPIRHLDQLLATLSDDRIGQAVEVSVLRGGQVQKLKVTVGEQS
jgi:S1-C subfamily serine protease